VTDRMRTVLRAGISIGVLLAAMFAAGAPFPKIP
jgi:hypothetical protein